MKKEISLQNRQVTYLLRKSKRARRMRLAVYCDGSVVVTAPFDLRETVAERFIREKSQWLFSKLTFFKKFKSSPIAHYSKRDYLEHRDSAYQFVVARIQQINHQYGFRYNQINIKNQKTRWGSCSKKGNLNFNYKIKFLPPRLADYIIAHELCHLKEFNHSWKFWNLVSRTFTDYKEIRKEMIAWRM